MLQQIKFHTHTSHEPHFITLSMSSVNASTKQVPHPYFPWATFHSSQPEVCLSLTYVERTRQWPAMTNSDRPLWANEWHCCVFSDITPATVTGMFRGFFQANTSLALQIKSQPFSSKSFPTRDRTTSPHTHWHTLVAAFTVLCITLEDGHEPCPKHVEW